ncbi:MAG: hypothetical protein D6731_00900 [Planctomycetota bacterium]|nr:MAG: hypothetical protein D6731_00900 [Planctomycetota bacterium]
MFCLGLGLLLAAASGGCRASAQAYVDEHSGGNFIVKGRILRVVRLSSSSWEPLSDGFVLRVDPEGCAVTVNQLVDGDKTKKTTFNLVEGDAIIWAEDFDYVLSSLDQKQGTTGTPAPPAPEDDRSEGADDEG